VKVPPFTRAVIPRSADLAFSSLIFFVCFVLNCSFQDQGYLLLRPITAGTSHENLKKAEAFVKKIQIYPLAEAANPPATKHVETYGKRIDALPHYDATYFEGLHKIVQEEIVLEQDKPIMRLLDAIGIRKGEPYAPDDKMKAVFDAAAKDTLQCKESGSCKESAQRIAKNRGQTLGFTPGSVCGQQCHRWPGGPVDHRANRGVLGLKKGKRSFTVIVIGALRLRLTQPTLAGQRKYSSSSWNGTVPGT